jgi:flavin reductase (DIM6/NTAB) family NADH-FMN oxidoreductase RutF
MDKAAMYQLTYGLFVLSAAEGGKDNGCIINTAAQVTTTPNRITIAVNKQNYTHDMILRTGLFNLAILDRTVPFEAFQRFGFQSGRDVDKFAGGKAVRMENGILMPAEHVTAWISGHVAQAIDIGTHTLFLSDVADAGVLSGLEPVTYALYQKEIKPKPQPTVKKGWRCKVCGYVYEGEELPADFVCPICKHGAQDFERIG